MSCGGALKISAMSSEMNGSARYAAYYCEFESIGMVEL